MRLKWIPVAAIFGALAVGMGAFGAHALKPYLSESMVKIYETANKYHFYHSILLLILGYQLVNNNLTSQKMKMLNLSSWFISVGILIFSGSLYILAITEIRILGAITPIGGVSFILGWLILAWTYIKNAE
jgi:uncharacterized membrane protein YgdD (TMEM256/DUF423 family)